MVDHGADGRSLPCAEDDLTVAGNRHDVVVRLHVNALAPHLR